MDYKYQTEAAHKVLENALDTTYLASVLAACPSSGKTTISHIIINEYIKKHPFANVVVLTEGQNTLKDQYLEELKTPNVEINFTYGSFGSDAQVQVGIPQSIHNLKIKGIDLLIVDECHRYYFGRMDREIIKKYHVEHQIIMTGSPTMFNNHNMNRYGKKYAMHYISGEQLKKMGVFSAVDLDIVKIKNKDPLDTIKTVWTESKKTGVNLTKVLIACPDIEYASKIESYLTNIGRKVVISTSKNDPDNTQLNMFKKGYFDVLLVVNKGVLGFNDPFITAILDLKSSSNIDISNQLFARVLRTHPEKIRKSYIRVAHEKYNNQVYMLHKMLSLMEDFNFRHFTGNNLKIIS